MEKKKKKYVKPETVVIKIDSDKKIMIVSCACHGHCPCSTNSDPQNNKCHCSNRPKYSKPIEEEWD